MHQSLAIVDRRRGGFAVHRLARLAAIAGAVAATSGLLAMTAAPADPDQTLSQTSGQAPSQTPSQTPPGQTPRQAPPIADPPVSSDAPAAGPTDAAARWRTEGPVQIGDRVVIREIGRHERRGTVTKMTEEAIVLAAPGSDTPIVVPRIRIVQEMVLLPADANVEVEIEDVNGFVRYGRLIEDTFDEVVIDIRTITVRVPRDRIRRVLVRPSFEVRYARVLDRTDLSDPEQVIRLSQWLTREERWDLAEALLVPILEADPDQLAVKGMLERVRARRALDRQRAARIDDDPGDAGSGDDTDNGNDLLSRPTSNDLFARTLVSDDDVNIMRVYEIDFANPPRRVAVTRATVDRLITMYADHERMPTGRRDRARLHRLEPMELVEIMFTLRARDLYPEIKVIDEPASLVRFRRDVHDTYVQNTCGACHGDPGAGRFRLHTRNARDPRARMTNLLILERLDLGSAGKLIDYDRPEDSLLIQYGLPRDQARNPHPPVDGFRAAFRNRDARQISETIRWIQTMYRPRPEYPVSYDPNALLVPIDRVDR
ncbi:MAG: hypothetical protein AB8G96_12230 [Phycisphaerales bacterium]